MRNKALVITLVQRVRRLPTFVWSVEESSVFGVAQQELENSSASSAHGDVQSGVSTLTHTKTSEARV